jgi:DNA-binding transcriptional LysR family regulator
MNISYLDSFLTVVSQGSFSAAAKSLGISQPAVSFQVQAMEKYLGISLFTRAGKKLKLTPEGEVALAYARTINDNLAKLKAEIDGLRDHISGAVIISASTIPGEYLVPRLLARYKAKYPDVELTLNINDTEKTISDVTDGFADAGFVGSLPDATAKKISSSLFAEDKLVLVASPADAAAAKKTVSIKDLVGQALILREQGSGSRKVFESALKKTKLSIDDFDVIMELGSNQAVLSAVESGLGFSVLSELAAGPAADLGTVKTASFKDLDLRRPLYFIKSTVKKESRAAAAFIAMVQDKS